MALDHHGDRLARAPRLALLVNAVLGADVQHSFECRLVRILMANIVAPVTWRNRDRLASTTAKGTELISPAAAAVMAVVATPTARSAIAVFLSSFGGEPFDHEKFPEIRSAIKQEPKISSAVDTQLVNVQSHEGTATAEGPPPLTQITTDSNNAMPAVRPTLVRSLILRILRRRPLEYRNLLRPLTVPVAGQPHDLDRRIRGHLSPSDFHAGVRAQQGDPPLSVLPVTSR